MKFGKYLFKLYMD